MAIYNALQDAHKTALSVGDKGPKLKLIDTVSMYNPEKKLTTGFYNAIGIVSNNPEHINLLGSTLKHEVSGHASPFNNDREFAKGLYAKYSKTSVTQYAEEKGISLQSGILEKLKLRLTKVFKKAKIKNYKQQINYALCNPLEFVAVLKQYSNSIDFAKMPADDFEELKKLLEACGTPKGFFADRIMLPKKYKSTQWKKFGQELLRQVKNDL